MYLCQKSPLNPNEYRKSSIFAAFFKKLNTKQYIMEGKGIVKLFLVLMAIVSLIQLFYFIPTRNVEKKAAAYAEEVAASASEESKYAAEKIAKATYLDSMSGEKIMSIPLLADYTYSDLKKRQLAFGLDLQGGMSAVLQVDLEDFLKTLATNKAKDPEFLQALDKAKEAQKSSQSDFVTLFSNAYQSIAPGKKLSKIFGKSEVLGDINTETTNGEVTRMLRENANETVSLTFKMLKERVDRLGVSQPNVSLDAGRDLILVEVPGIDNPKRLEDMIGKMAQLEFWDTYRITDNGIAQALAEADKRLATAMGVDQAEKFDTIYTPNYDDNGTVTDSTMQLVKSTDIFGNQGPLMSKLKVNGAGGQMQYASTVLGASTKSNMDEVMKMLQTPEVKALFPLNSEFMWSYKPHKDYETREMTKDYTLYLIKKRPGSDKAPLEGDVITNANQDIDPNTGEVGVSVQMDARGAKEWARMTTDAFNNGKREIAIALDGRVVSAPGLNNGPILGGSSSITGNFNIQEAIDFANILEVGKLPAKTKIVQKSTVGPTLGQANINSSLRSLMVGFGLLLLFMLFYYAGGGVVSIIALFANLLFIFGTLSSLGTVLTLPGIAGIVLTIGMAVDANVIIFERIREELRAGKSNLVAISDGFRNSYSAIIDANVTTLLTAMVLAYFGLGPIKGFAVVLIIGVLSSLFTAVLFGRLMIDSYTSRGKEMSFWNNATKNTFANLQVDWIGKRKVAYVVSGVLIVAGLASIFTKGFDLGVDFKGGYSYTVEFPEGSNLDIQTVRDGLTTAFEKAPIVKQVDAANTLSITTDYLIGSQEDDADAQVLAKLHQGLNTMMSASISMDNFLEGQGDGIHLISSNKVGATIADDIKSSSYLAGIFALLLIFLYIFLRFNKWQYSLGAVVALFHDSLIVLGLFSIFHGILPFSLEIDQAFIAAILTVIGYSINDTVVVFDRVREFLGIYTNKDKDEVINMAINSTFSRTIITSLTTLLVVGTLLIFGGGAIKGFAFALLVGILVGTYSSIFVATPIVRDLSDDLTAPSRSTGAAGTEGKSAFSRSKIEPTI